MASVLAPPTASIGPMSTPTIISELIVAPITTAQVRSVESGCRNLSICASSIPDEPEPSVDFTISPTALKILSFSRSSVHATSTTITSSVALATKSIALAKRFLNAAHVILSCASFLGMAILATKVFPIVSATVAENREQYTGMMASKGLLTASSNPMNTLRRALVSSNSNCLCSSVVPSPSPSTAPKSCVLNILDMNCLVHSSIARTVCVPNVATSSDMTIRSAASRAAILTGSAMNVASSCSPDRNFSTDLPQNVAMTAGAVVAAGAAAETAEAAPTARTGVTDGRGGRGGRGG